MPEYRDQHQAGIGVTVQSGVVWCVIVCYLIVLSVVVLACYCCVVVSSTAISGWYHSDCETQWFLARRIIPRSLNSTKESMGFQCEQVCTFNDICWKSSPDIYIYIQFLHSESGFRHLIFEQIESTIYPCLDHALELL